MHVRDATAGDTAAVAGLAAADIDAARLIRDRTVQVAVADDGDDEDVIGFLSYETGRDAVHITRIAGDAEAVEALLDPPQTFATRETLPVEVVRPANGTDDITAALVAASFESAGPGPVFAGEPTTRYRWEP
ncbi:MULTISPECIES: hypothetical protein [Halobacterium]|uniref:Acetyltransferase domain protein n=4 Tax=Halobacterium salinarum TaxID=2242 RepID=Q9HMV0_HALSA|nr:hypothetical protein [Halobacterium salinarum]AAG20471.1 hypothetical protein VNG_2376H [Halobacterium salinarum NRC-1]MBB6089598.1 hypothetical protein [Halobacterium salinarum]MCF2164346.1 hypothetical protein [Halobacterium salinarum]MCF2167133.1 hypothetical protein [Halobacterium salinarum]MDL0120996.1 hypothetical protein [Halobacterium salinarum]